MTIKEFRELRRSYGFLDDSFGLAINDADSGFIYLFVIDNYNHSIVFNNISTKYNRKYFLAEPDKIKWIYDKDTYEIEGLTKDVFKKYIANFTKGVKTVKTRIKIKKLREDFSGKPFKPSRRRKRK